MTLTQQRRVLDSRTDPVRMGAFGVEQNGTNVAVMGENSGVRSAIYVACLVCCCRLLLRLTRMTQRKLSWRHSWQQTCCDSMITYTEPARLCTVHFAPVTHSSGRLLVDV